MAAAVAQALRAVLAGVVEGGTARRLDGMFLDTAGDPVRIGGKTGSGDNRFVTYSRGGLRSSRAVSRTGTFAFYIGDQYFGVLTVHVGGGQANNYSFTSALPVAALERLAPAIQTAARD
jgi:cell division protein FtsI/penicillin-binding protein 2